MKSIKIQLINSTMEFTYRPSVEDKKNFKRRVHTCLENKQPLNFYCADAEKEIIIPYKFLRDHIIEI